MQEFFDIIEKMIKCQFNVSWSSWIAKLPVGDKDAMLFEGFEALQTQEADRGTECGRTESDIPGRGRSMRDTSGHQETIALQLRSMLFPTVSILEKKYSE
jgi:hypothetical protein